METLPAETRARCFNILTLVALGGASLCLVSTVDRLSFNAAISFLPRFAAFADARVPSFCLCLGLWRLLHQERTEDRRRQRRLWAWVVSAAWLAGTVIADFIVGVYIPQVRSLTGVAAFLLFGLMAEEFLFRGVIFELVEAIWPGRAVGPILISSLLFSLQHLQYHHFSVTRDALAQVAYTFPMGVAFGFLRWQTARLWPAASLHFLNNGLAVARLFTMGA